MIPGFFINLDRAEARRRYMEDEIARLDLPITRFAAVNGKELSDADYQTWHPEAGDMHRLSPSEVACYLSHLGIWKIIAEGDARFGAVFEDDIQLSDEAGKFLRSDAWVPTEIEALKIETSRRWVRLGPDIGVEGRSLAPLQSRHLAAGGYVLSKALAARLVAETTVIRNPVDYDLFDPKLNRLGAAQMWQLTPAICVQQVRAGGRVFLPQDAEASDLDARRGTSKRSGIAKLRAEITRPFQDAGRYLRGKAWAAKLGGQFIVIPFQ